MTVPQEQGELDEILVMLGAIAMQPTPNNGPTLVAQELATMKANLAVGERVFTIMSAGTGNGFGKTPLLVVDMAQSLPQGQQPSNTWVDTGFNKLWIDSRIQVTGPFPSLQLIGRPGSLQAGPTGPREDREYFSVIYNIDCIAIASGDIGYVTQRKAILDAVAFLKAVRIDSSLGGLVEVIKPVRPLEPGGGGGAGAKGSTVMAARVTLGAKVLHAY